MRSKRILIAFYAIAVLLFVMPLGTTSANQKTTIQIFAAVSLQNALMKLSQIYERIEPNVELHFKFGGSGGLRKEIEEGAPVDLMISANKKNINKLVAEDLAIPGTRVDLLGNKLVLIVAETKKNTIKTFSDLSDKGISICIGKPAWVPAGMYAKETLINLKLWDKLQKKIVFADDVRQVPLFVESGNVDAGIVYWSDTAVLKGVHVAAIAPKGSHQPIVYTMAAVKASKKLEPTQKFMKFLRSPAAARIFADYRFIPLGK